MLLYGWLYDTRQGKLTSVCMMLNELYEQQQQLSRKNQLLGDGESGCNASQPACNAYFNPARRNILNHENFQIVGFECDTFLKTIVF